MLRRRVRRGAAGRCNGPADLVVGEPGRPRGDRELGEHCLVPGLGGAARGPEQPVVPVALLLLADPRGEAAQVAAASGGRAGCRMSLVVKQAGDLAPVQAAGPGLVPEPSLRECMPSITGRLARRGEDSELQRGD